MFSVAAKRTMLESLLLPSVWARLHVGPPSASFVENFSDNTDASQATLAIVEDGEHVRLQLASPLDWDDWPSDADGELISHLSLWRGASLDTPPAEYTLSTAIAHGPVGGAYLGVGVVNTVGVVALPGHSIISGDDVRLFPAYPLDVPVGVDMDTLYTAVVDNTVDPDVAFRLRDPDTGNDLVLTEAGAVEVYGAMRLPTAVTGRTLRFGSGGLVLYI